ncbi:hypothetical protein GYMLUDRAFT_44722 [Collybiopsis luxurians FD-317 M1]|uniref:Uncharacterized protein n=1 Tax=Collybiopsis luxurians FD-317 M1 TaxID=944289 RepID=A0A0D0BV25_9AGAR|nr:hypothetical protein GYMLUDRAFT_44722 [Collybiopsis luxurians FD-317 M1]
MTMQCITVVMYLISTTHVILALQIDYNAFAINRNADEVFNRLGGYPTTLAQLALEFTNCAFADSILIWRVWVLWNRRWTIIVLPICLVLASATSSYIYVYEVSKINSTQAKFSDVFARHTEVVSVIFASCIVATNLLCTGLIAGRIWWHNRQLQLSLGRQVASRRYRAIFFTILESGTIYSMAWVLLIILDLANSNAVFPMIDMVAQLTGIVPALIVVLVARSVNEQSTFQWQDSSVSALSSPRFQRQHTTTTFQLMTTGPIIEEATPTVHLMNRTSFSDNVGLDSEGSKV